MHPKTTIFFSFIASTDHFLRIINDDVKDDRKIFDLKRLTDALRSGDTLTEEDFAREDEGELESEEANEKISELEDALGLGRVDGDDEDDEPVDPNEVRLDQTPAAEDADGIEGNAVLGPEFKV